MPLTNFGYRALVRLRARRRRHSSRWHAEERAMKDANATRPEIPRPGATRRGNRLIQAFVTVLSDLKAGTLTLIMPDDSTYVLPGDGTPGPHAVIRIKRWRALRRLTTQGDLGFIETYMEGDWESPDLADVVELGALNADTWKLSRL